MVARRLIAILLVMLFISSLAAVLAPVEPRTDETSTTTTTERPSSGSTGELIRQSLTAREGRPQVVTANTGDQLQLRISSERPGTLVVGGIGDSEDVGPGAPASFDLLLRETGEYPVRYLESGREVATIEVSPIPPTGPEPAT